MVILAARYPRFDPGTETWEAYWEDLHFIPERHLLEGLLECRMTCKFFPSVAEIIHAAIGNHFSIVPSNGRREATVADIVKVYRERHDSPQLPPGERHRELEDKRK